MNSQQIRSNIIQKRGYKRDIAGSDLSIKIASYPITAQYLAERLAGKSSSICELCCGVGVSLIELSKSFNEVQGVDYDPQVLVDCAANLENAGLVNYELFKGEVDDSELLAKITAGIVLYDIPYWSNHDGQVDPDEQNPPLKELLNKIRKIVTKDIVIYAPKHMTYNFMTQQIGECDFVKVYINNKHDRNFIFLGGLIEKVGISKVKLTI